MNSVSFFFAVEVPYVTLNLGSDKLTDGKTLNVTAGIPVDLKCTPGHSRPLPTIDWYISGSLQQSSATIYSYTLNASDADHNGTIYCKAYNDFSKSTVESGKPILYVFGKLTMAVGYACFCLTSEIFLKEEFGSLFECY